METIDVYKNGNLITTLKSWEDPSPKIYDDENQDSWIEIQYAEKDTSADYSADFYPFQCSGVCDYYFNGYIIHYADDDFLMNISVPEEYFVQGENVTVNIEVTNNLNINVFSDITARFSTPTLFGSQEKVDTKSILLIPGKNLVSFTLFALSTEAELNVEVNATIRLSASNLKGLNYQWGGYRTSRIMNEQCVLFVDYCYISTSGGSQRDIDIDGSAPVGYISKKIERLKIIPNPIYYEKGSEPCKENYVLNKEGTYCLLNTVKNLSCVLTGCPEGFTPPYVCTSSGLCGQTIYVATIPCTSDEYCRQQTGLIATKCDIPSGFCFNEIIYEKIIQCNSPSDCLIPCIGKTPICENNICNYIGECIKQPVPGSGGFNLWDLIQNIWNTFWNWVKSLFS